MKSGEVSESCRCSPMSVWLSKILRPELKQHAPQACAPSASRPRYPRQRCGTPEPISLPLVFPTGTPTRYTICLISHGALADARASDTMGRTIIIGDIHGCFDELSDLLRAAELQTDDRVIAVGDLVTKGPKDREVLDRFIDDDRFSSVIGHHD